MKLSRLEKKYRHITTPYFGAARIKPRKYKKLVKRAVLIYLYDLEKADILSKMEVFYPMIGGNKMAALKININ